MRILQMRSPLRLIGILAIVLLLASNVSNVVANVSDSPLPHETLQAAGTKLAFTGQPAGGVEGQPWAKFPSTTVSVQDATGNLDSTNNSTVVTLAITSGTGVSGAVLTCDNDENTTTAGVQATVGNGVAPFFGCAIDKAGSYTLTASATGLTSAVSASFSVTANPTSTPTPIPSATSTPTPTPVVSNCSWTGDWSTQFNAMHLTQSGSTVTGTYEWDSGRITGTVSGNQYSGRWSEYPSYTEPSDAGRFVFTISANCNSFTGTWGYGSSSTGGSWSGTRMSAAAPTPSPTTVPVGPSGGDIAVGGGAGADGGVTVSVPAGSFASTVNLTVSVSASAPTGVSASGAVLLPKTVEVSTDTGAGLSETVELRVNLTAAELGGRDISTIKGGVVVGNTVDPRPTRVLNATDGTLGVTLDHFSKFTLFAITNPGPANPAPAAGAMLDKLGITLSWSNPVGTTQYQLQVVPFNNDGPGVNVIRNAESSFVVPAPPDWYGLLPDMLYFWRVRTTTATTTPTEVDWTAWGSWTFRTPKVTSATINAVSPAQGAVVSSRTPTLTWSNTNLQTFYYEVQVSKDASFNTDPATATAMVYAVLLHGGVTTPPNSYVIPAAFPLEASTTYFWRVRPRIQGDGAPIAWSQTWSFQAQ